ncbi:MAG: transposase [Nitrospirae bacterium]|nr:transposase [Nitrospirota bacterium]
MSIYNPEIHKRRSIRLKDYDYSQAGAYFITICIKDRECLFGNIVDREMRINSAGEMVLKAWNDLPAKYSNVRIDEFIVMPNHVHGIIILYVGAGPCACPVYKYDGNLLNAEGYGRPSSEKRQSQIKGQPQGVAPTISLSDIVHRFKSFTTSQYRINVLHNNWPPFPGKLWQRNYYEHIIRNETELNKIREYIINNPLNWESDENYR